MLWAFNGYQVMPRKNRFIADLSIVVWKPPYYSQTLEKLYHQPKPHTGHEG